MACVLKVIGQSAKTIYFFDGFLSLLNLIILKKIVHYGAV